MSNLTKYHLTHTTAGWILKKEGDATGVNLGSPKEDAVKKAAQKLANTGSSLRIHRLDGTFEEERTYPRSMDPKSPG